jgi:hypothetical protein
MGEFPNQVSARSTAQTLMAAILEQTNAATTAPQETVKKTAATDKPPSNSSLPASPARRALFRKFFINR